MIDYLWLNRKVNKAMTDSTEHLQCGSHEDVITMLSKVSATNRAMITWLTIIGAVIAFSVTLGVGVLTTILTNLSTKLTVIQDSLHQGAERDLAVKMRLDYLEISFKKIEDQYKTARVN